MKNFWINLLISLLSIPVTALCLNAQYTLIPDPHFEQVLLDKGIDSEGLPDGQVLTADVEVVTYLELYFDDIHDLTGIQDFSNLDTLKSRYNNYGSVDLSGLPQLKYFSSRNDSITSIDLTGLGQLHFLQIQNNLLQSLEFSDSNGLLELLCDQNDISSLDLSHCHSLSRLTCSGNNLTVVDVTQNSLLQTLTISDNPVPTFSLSHLPLLKILAVAGTGFSSIDVSSNPLLENLLIDNIPGLNSVDVSLNPQLQVVSAENSDLTSLDLSANPLIDFLWCPNNSLLSLDLSVQTDLNFLNCADNQLIQLKLDNGNNSNLGFFDARNNPGLNCIQVDDPLYSDSTWISVDEGVIFSTDCGTEGPDCSAFTTAPTDLNKSFNPVNGVHDRVQLKWYKGAGQIRYSVEDNAACDIQYWAYRSKLGPEDDWNTIPLNERDTLMLPYTTVKKTNGRELFKWPLKYRLNNGTNQVQPNHGYRWRVRCYCDQGELVNGVQEISPWSEEKFFNTPDFDPLTGIYTPVTGAQMNEDKAMDYFSSSFDLFPNPSQGNGFYLDLGAGAESYALMTLVDLSGREVHSEMLQFSQKASGPLFVDLHLELGVYLVSLKTSQGSMTKRLLVTR